MKIKVPTDGNLFFEYVSSYVPTKTLHNIYEIYRSLLNYAASQGYPRANYETPYEFSVRLAHHYPLMEPHLAMITSTYVTTRYAGTMLKPDEVSATHYAWIAVQQNWQ